MLEENLEVIQVTFTCPQGFTSIPGLFIAVVITVIPHFSTGSCLPLSDHFKITSRGLAYTD